MKAKTINKILSNKFRGFVNSIEDEDLKKVLQKGTIITGGCIVSMLLNEDVNDYDLYFRDFETTKAIAEYFVNRYKDNNSEKKNIEVKDNNGRVKIFIRSAGVESETLENENYMYFEQLDIGDPTTEEFVDNALEFAKKGTKSKKYEPVFLTSNAISLSGDIQLILRFYGEPEEIHKNYDFVHCTNFWKSWDNELVLSKEALESILTKELVYTGSLYPVCSIMRIRKFIKRGWTITAGQSLKIMWQISKLDLGDFRVLEDQLIGVDVAYFYQLIDMIKQAQNEGKNIDYSYICELIDEIF